MYWSGLGHCLPPLSSLRASFCVHHILWCILSTKNGACLAWSTDLWEWRNERVADLHCFLAIVWFFFWDTFTNPAESSSLGMSASSSLSSKWPLMTASSVLAIGGALSASFFIWKEALLSGVHFQITRAQSLPRDLWLICGYYDPNVAPLAFKGILFPCSLLGRCLSPTTFKLSLQACDPTSSLCLQGSNSSALSKEVFEEGSTPSSSPWGLETVGMIPNSRKCLQNSITWPPCPVYLGHTHTKIRYYLS